MPIKNVMRNYVHKTKQLFRVFSDFWREITSERSEKYEKKSVFNIVQEPQLTNRDWNDWNPVRGKAC